MYTVKEIVGNAMQIKPSCSTISNYTAFNL